MQNQLCRVCDEPAAGFHFGAFTCEGCKSFFGRTSNNQSVIQECKNNYQCVINKKNRTACKACRLRKCLMVGMSKSGSRYGRRSNWFKIHCLMQQNLGGAMAPKPSPPGSSASSSSLSPTAPLGLWPSPPKTEQHKRASPIVEVQRETHSSSPPRSPEEAAAGNAPSMVPPAPSPFSHLSAASPFKSLLPSLPISSASLPISTASLPPVTAAAPAPPKTDPVAALATAAPPPPIMSLYAGFPSPLTGAAFPGVPLHKQALLSPLLAQSHLWQQLAAFRQNPLMRPPTVPAPPTPPAAPAASATPDLDLINAEHKALMERFAAVAAAAAAAAAAATAAAAEDDKPASPPPASPPKSAEPQNCPIDLSSKKSDDGNDSEAERSTPSSVVKADLNRNNIVDTEKKAEKEESSVLDLCNK